MKTFIFLFAATILVSCSYPQYTTKSIRKLKSQNYHVTIDKLAVRYYHFSAAQRKGSLRAVSDTLEINQGFEGLMQSLLDKFGVQYELLVADERLDTLINPKLRWRSRKLKAFLSQIEYVENTVVPIVCYNVSFAPEKSGGGGSEFIYKTGNDRYYMAHQLYIAYYDSIGLAYLRNVSRWDEKIVPAGTPITHEFPQEVLDTLMHMALEPLFRQMEKNSSKRKKRQ